MWVKNRVDLRGLILYGGLLTLAARGAFAAHFCTGDPQPADARNEFELWGGFSARSGGPIASTTDHHFTVGGFHYGRRCWSWSKISLSYDVDVLPVALVRVPPEGIYAYTVPPGTVTGIFISFNPFVPAPAHTVYGFAATPVGMTVDAWRTHKIYPFAQVDGGLIKSTEPVPYNTFSGSFVRDASFNFLLSMGGGVKIRMGKVIALSLGYKLMHISDGGRTSFNPGLDNHVVFAAVSLLK